MYAVVVIPYNPERTFINILLFFSMIKASYFRAIIRLLPDQKTITQNLFLNIFIGEL